ncbi:alpha-(1-_3)-arabinofuranosyltransferase [Streptomyces apocyni]|uniref:alpha-(1->3)-arabinofuranosyltransferase n=1 Tax=Streptomyces apocyni TaxID=2654677 RepID=UPI0012E9F9C1|nr:alpha-(1->3)-arabinofuranosyltransferase [Streptomyces apocyni]
MTTVQTTPQLPPQAPVPTGGPAQGPPPDGPRSRRWLLGFWAVVFVLFLVVSPGRMTFETKLGVALDPWKFLSELGQLWQSQGGFGGLTNQYIGYAFPSLPFYALADLVALPVWLAERLWMSLIVAAAFWGAMRLAERLNIGSSATRLLGAAAFALWPTYTIVVGSTSAAALPGAMLPWVLLPLTNDKVSARIAALRSAALIPLMGGVNAASVLASLLPVALYLLSRPGGPRKRKLIIWWVPGVLLATAWWVVPLLLQGLYGENFLPYVESAQTTTDTMSATEALRGAGNWVAYLHFGDAWLPAGWTVATGALAILGSAIAAALGLAGLARRDLPERRWLVLTVATVALITLAGYGGTFGGLFHSTVQDWLDGWLVPFRNIYKFQTGLALALAFGLIHLVAVAAERRGARPVPGRRFVPAIAALLVIPGLALPYVNGSILQPGSFQELPKYWKTTAGWLEKYSPDSRALVVPATAHGIYTWGSPIDQPLDVLADSRWAQRDYVPFGTPGNRRAMDAVEQALLTGGTVPGLQDYLSRSGLHFVVVRNDLDPDQVGYVPTTTVKRTLEASGYERVTGFGPEMTGGRIADKTPLQVEGLYPRQRAVEIYQPSDQTHRPGQVGVQPVADTAVVSGGPEALLPLSADPAMRNRPVVLTGDNHPGLGSPSLLAVGDGLRRADTRFGLVNSNTSYTYTPDEKNHSGSLQNPGEKPLQILPSKGVEHQTTAVIAGAKSVTASSSGNWLFHLPQYDPVNAFDGNGDTAWAEGSAGKPEGQWLRVDFDKKDRPEIPGTLAVRPLAQDQVRAAPTRVRVETDRGKVDSVLLPNGTPQEIKAPKGEAKWLKITILDVEEASPGLSGAGFSEITIPGVTVNRVLALPKDAEDVKAKSTMYSMHRAADPGGLGPNAAEMGLHRQFTTKESGEYTFKGSAIAVPGNELDELLYRVAPETKSGKQLKVTADSTAPLGPNVSPRNLSDGDLTTAWIAGDSAVLHLSWPDKTAVGEIVFAAAGGLSTRPEKIKISSPDGSTTAGVDENGMARFEPITTNQMDITITKTAPLTLHNSLADKELQLPVGLTLVHVPALSQEGNDHRTPQPDPERSFELACGEGPEVAIGGELYSTSAKGTVGDLTQRRPIDVTLCTTEEADGTVQLGADTHRVDAADKGPLVITDISLTRGAGLETASGSTTADSTANADRDVKVSDWAGDRRALTVGAGDASYLSMYENANDGWKATLNGKELTSLRLDGWQQGWLIPEGEGGTVKLEYRPAQVYQAGLIGGGVALLVLLGLVLYRRDEENTDGPSPVAPAPGLILGTVALAVIGVVISGPFGLLVPALAVVAWWRRSLLVPIALVAMAGAGIAAAIGAGQTVSEGEGAFSPVAQVLALVALFAALVTGREESSQARETEPPVPSVTPVPAGATLPLGPYAPGTIPAAGPGTAPPRPGPQVPAEGATSREAAGPGPSVPQPAPEPAPQPTPEPASAPDDPATTSFSLRKPDQGESPSAAAAPAESDQGPSDTPPHDPREGNAP